MMCLEVTVLLVTSILGIQTGVHAAGCGPTEPCDSKYSSLSATHTACITDLTGVNTGISNAEKIEIVNTHNDYRSKVADYNDQPYAKNMQKMVWDDELAMVAQKWASHCEWHHDENIDRELPDRFKAGQNLAASSSPTKDWNVSIDGWQNEVHDFSFGNGPTSAGKAVGHYTQVVWATSSKIGCGYAECPELKNTPYKNGGFYVCNYGPPGNFGSETEQYTPYNAGASASDQGADCPNTKDATGLCDCAGRACHFGTQLLVDQCTCECKLYGATYSTLVSDGYNCKKNCTSPTDLSSCVSYSTSDCVYTNIPWVCPVMCKLCE